MSRTKAGQAPERKAANTEKQQRIAAQHKPDVRKVTVLMADPRQPDSVKRNCRFNPEDFHTINTLKNALNHLEGYRFDYLDNHKHLLKQLSQEPPEFVLNLCDEGYNNQLTKEPHIPAMLEMLGIPYYLAPDVNATMISPTFPALLKPARGDSSLGITQRALVYNRTELRDYVEYLHELLPGVPVLVQEFLSGPEYSVGLIGRLECRDYARFDFRCDAEGTAKLLEVNANPGWCWDGKLNLMAGYAGKEYRELLSMVLDAALKRVAA